MAEAPPPTVIPGNNTRVTGGIDEGRFIRAVGNAFSGALRALGDNEVTHIKEDLSVPVEVGPGGRIIRSAPGDPPRKEFGILQENVEASVVAGAGSHLPSLRISSSRPPVSAGDDPDAPRILEFELHRPYMTPALVRLKGYARDFLAKFFS